MKPVKNLALFLGVACFCSSCATIISGTSSLVSLDSNPQGATVYAQSKRGELVIGTTPTMAPIHKRTTALEFRLEGYYSETEAIIPGIDGWYFGNLLLGGLPGMIVDLSTGAYKTLPARVNSNLKREED